MKRNQNYMSVTRMLMYQYTWITENTSTIKLAEMEREAK